MFEAVCMQWRLSGKKLRDHNVVPAAKDGFAFLDTVAGGHSGIKRYRYADSHCFCLCSKNAAAPFLHVHLLAANEVQNPGNADAWIKFAEIAPDYVKKGIDIDELRQHLAGV